MKSISTYCRWFFLCLLPVLAAVPVSAQVQLWGTSTVGGANNAGTIFSYDLAAGGFTKQYDFPALVSFANSVPGGLVLYNNKLYGLNEGTVYCFDPATGTYTSYYVSTNNLGQATIPEGAPALLNGKLYFMSFSIGSNSSIWVFDPATNTTTDLYDLDVNNDGQLVNSSNGVTRNGKLTVYNGKLYGLAIQGGMGSAFGSAYPLGTLFEFDPAAGPGAGFVKKMDFGTMPGGNLDIYPLGGLAVCNNLLYGICQFTGVNGDQNGMLFSYDPAQNGTAGFSEVHSFYDGIYDPATLQLTQPQFSQWNGVLSVYNNKVYGTTDAGGPSGGVVFSYDPSGSGTFTKEYGFSSSAAFENPFTGLTLYQDKFYGTATSPGNGALYQFDPASKSATALYALSTAIGSPDGGGGFSELTVVNLRPTPTINFTLPAKTYGDAPFEPGATTNNAAVPITYISKDPSIATVYQDAADGNKWKIKILGAGKDSISAIQAAGGGYFEDTVKVALVVGKASLAVNAPEVTTVLNQPLPVFSWSYSGWAGADNKDNTVINGTPVLTTTATQGSPVGTYPITVTDVSGLSSANYNFTIGSPGILTISATGSTPQTIHFDPLPAAAYGDADISLAATTDAAGLTVTYSSSNPAVAAIAGGKIHIMGAGMATITASQAGNVTYSAAPDVPQILTVNKAVLTITADDKTINRGDPLPALTATYHGFVNSETATVLNPPASLTTGLTSSSTPGIYDIVVAGAASPNYTITLVNGKLTIRGTQLITWTPVSTLTYGDASFTPGAVSDAGITPAYTTDNPAVITLSGNQAIIKGAGTAIITATFPAGNGYDATTSTQTVTVQKRQLIIKADDKSRDYGQANPLFTATYSGWVNSDNETSGALLTLPTFNTSATIESPAGFYPITASGAVSENYEPAYLAGSLQVLTAIRTITFDPLPVKTYGDGQFDPGAIGSTGETITYSSGDPQVAVIDNGKVRITGAGTTTITASLPANSGYTGTSSAMQILTVNKASLVITADNQIVTQGSGAPLLTVSYNSFVNDDNPLALTSRPSTSTSATDQSAVGTYPITVSGASSPNYTISYVNGTLTIIPAAGSGANTLSAWCSSRSQLEVKVFTTTAQHAVLQLISVAGQRIYTQEVQLNSSLNQYELPVGNIPVGIYILRVAGEQFKLDQKVMVR